MESSKDIKFRAWIEDEHEFIYPNKLTIFDTVVYVYDSEADYEYQIEPKHLQRFVGLKAEDGRSVYEGDIIQFTYWWFDGNQAETHLIGEVVYIEREASYGLAHVRNKEWIEHIGGKPGDEDTQSFSGWQFSQDDIEILGNVCKGLGLPKEKR